MPASAVSPSERRRYGRQNPAVLAAQLLAWFALIEALHRPLSLPLAAGLLAVFRPPEPIPADPASVRKVWF